MRVIFSILFIMSTILLPICSYAPCHRYEIKPYNLENDKLFWINKIKTYEGFRATIYKNACDSATIGYGHRVRKNDTITCCDTIYAQNIFITHTHTHNQILIHQYWSSAKHILACAGTWKNSGASNTKKFFTLNEKLQ